MTNKHLFIGFFGVLAVVLAAGMVIRLPKNSQPLPFNQVEAAQEPEPTPPTEWSNEVRSGDGSVALRLQAKTAPSGEVVYTFSVVEAEGDPRNIFQKTVSGQTTLEIPFNSWSPDNKQLYIQEKTGDTASYYVLKASGEPFANGSEFLDVTQLWQESKNDFLFSTINGWAGNDLLELKTKKEDGSKGPSFWFVISSRGFMRLRG